MNDKPGKMTFRKTNRFLRFALLLFLPVLPGDLVYATLFPPAAVADLRAAPGAAGGEVRLTWTAPGDDILVGDITGGKFAVNYATYAASFNRNLAQVLVSTDMAAVSTQSYTIPGLSPGVTYYFALWTRDEVAANWSGVSNTTSAWAQLGAVSTPTAPGALSALALSSSSLHLGWTDNAVDEMGYRVLGSTPAIRAVLPADATYYIETGLLPNTSYYRAAEVFNSAGAAQTAPVTRYTLSSPSSGTYVSERSSWSVTVAWQANGNPPATRWGVERSTDNFSTYLVLVSSTDALTVRNYPDTGLADLTTYYYRVNSFNAESFASGYGVAASTVTLSTPTAPGGLSGAVLGVSSVAWTWADNAYNETGYRLRTSTGGLIVSLPAGATSYVESGLGGNQTCTRTVEAYNGAGRAVSASTTSYTLSAPPSGVYVYSRSSWTVGIAWQANTNSAATRWGVERSTDNFSTYQVIVDSAGLYTSLTLLDTGLADLTTYYYRVNSFNAESFVGGYGAVVSTVTLSTPTAPSGLISLAVSPYSIRYDWTDDAYNEEGYRIRSSTGILYLLPADSTYYVETGLIANTSYYREVEAYNGRGSAGAPFAVIFTSAAAPSGLYIVSRSSSGVRLGWQNGGNRAGTVWGIERSLTNSFASSTTLKTSTDNYTALTYLDTGLANMTVYYYHVRAFNGDGFSGPYSLNVSTLTLSTPTVPGGFSGEALDQGSIRWAWTDASNNEDGFDLRNNGGGLVANKPPGSSFHTETGLSPNLPYIRYVESYNGAGSSGTVKIAVNTMSAVPLISPTVTVTSYSVHIAWGLNGNPVGTYWGIDRSTDGFTTSQAVKVFEDYYSAMEYLDTAVLPNTMYYYRVKSYNNAGLASAPAETLGMTLPEVIPDVAPPDAVTDLTSAQGQVGGEVRLSWTAPGDDGPAGNITGGNLKIHYVTSSTVPLNINLAQVSVSTDMVAGSTQTYSLYGLNPGSTYYIGLWTRDEAPFNWSSLSNKTTAFAQIPPMPQAPAVFTGEAISTFSIRWSWPPGQYQDGYRLRNGAGGALIAAISPSATFYIEQGMAINTAYARYIQVYNYTGSSNSAQSSVYTLAAPPAGFGASMVGFSSITVSWTKNGNPSGALYRFQRWDVLTSTSTADMTATSASFSGLAEATTYYFKVGAVNNANIVSWSSAVLAVTTLGLPRTDTGLPAQSGIHLELSQASGLTLVDIPPEAFSVPLVITLKTPLTYPSDAAPRPGRPAAAGLEILTDRAVQPDKPVVITITYTDADVAGLNPARLAIARYDTARGAWLALPSSADPANHRVSAMTTHFSLFRLFEVNPSQTVLSSRVYPNPFRPSAGHTSVNFDGLPGEAVLKIYAFDGSKVRVLKCNASGVAVWDGKNAAGRDAASGLYFAYAESGSDSKIMTVVVQR